jgi:hypothetical protein
MHSRIQLLMRPILIGPKNAKKTLQAYPCRYTLWLAGDFVPQNSRRKEAHECLTAVVVSCANSKSIPSRQSLRL